MSPEEYGALADEIRRLPPKAIRGEDEENHLAALVRERLPQVLAGRGDTDRQIAAILGLMRTIEAEVGLPSWEPEKRDQVLAWLTFNLLAAECADSQDRPAPFEQVDQDACRIGAVSSEDYRTIAAEIAALPAVDWQEVHDDTFGVSEDPVHVDRSCLLSRAPRLSPCQGHRLSIPRQRKPARCVAPAVTLGTNRHRLNHRRILADD